MRTCKGCARRKMLLQLAWCDSRRARGKMAESEYVDRLVEIFQRADTMGINLDGD